MLKGLLFGFGNMGESVVQQMATRTDAQLIGVMDPTADRRAVAETKYGLKAAATTDQALNLGKIDFALVTSPNTFHCGQVLQAIQAGAHVYCEKPLALAAAECDQMVAAAEAAKRVNVVNFSIRFSGAGRTMKRLVEEGACGEILSAWRFRSRGYGLYSAGARHPAVVRPDHSGGWTMHHMCHDIDAIHWLVGAYERVWSLSRTTVPADAAPKSTGASAGQSEELIWAMAELQRKGQSVRPMAMIGDATHRFHLEDHGVSGSKGTLHLTHQNGQSVVVLQPEGGEVGLRSDSGKPLPKRVYETESAAEPGGGLGHFFDCLTAGKPSQVTFRDAAAAVRVALACQQSAKSGGQPVRVTE